MSEIRTNDIISETGLGPVGFSSGLTVGTAITCYAPTGNINVGSAISMYASSGIVSATKYYGDGSQLTGISAGAGGATALSLNDGVKANFGTDDDLRIYGGSGNSFIQHQDTAAGDLYIDAEASNVYIRSGDGGTSEENAIVCENNGKVKLYHSGTHVAETSANGLAFPSGKGIDFSATADAGTTGASMTSEVLDWYEEGTWTPSITFGGTSAFSGGSMGASLGSYTRVGRLVIANFDTVINNKGSSGGLVHLNGLPFQSGGGAYRGGTCLAFNTWMNTDQKCSRTRIYLGDNRTYLQLLWNSLDNLNNSDCNTSGQICGVITYQVP